MYIILTGKISVYEHKHDSEDVILVNEYFPGQSVCDPELNQTATVHSHVVVTSKTPAKLFILNASTYVQVYQEKLLRLRDKRQRIVAEKFAPFNTWIDERLKNFITEAKVRILNKDEILCRENCWQNYTYLLVEGKVRVEKTVFVEQMNYWPKKHEEWVQKTIRSQVLFKI